jgi:predicted amidohydrolase YtcJ
MIRNARVFNGHAVPVRADVRVEGSTIVEVGRDPNPGVGTEVIDGGGKTVLPGLIDSHAHAKPPALTQAIVFGVTTEMDMGSDPRWMLTERGEAATRNDVVLGGHLSMLIGSFFEEQFAASPAWRMFQRSSPTASRSAPTTSSS